MCIQWLQTVTMPPIWNQEESNDCVYKPVERHSPGMISFTYQTAASAEVLEALKHTDTFESPESEVIAAE
jgi:hypothetical protein